MMMHLHQLCKVAIIELQTLHKKKLKQQKAAKKITLSFREVSHSFYTILDLVSHNLTGI